MEAFFITIAAGTAGLAGAIAMIVACVIYRDWVELHNIEQSRSIRGKYAAQAFAAFVIGFALIFLSGFIARGLF